MVKKIKILVISGFVFPLFSFAAIVSDCVNDASGGADCNFKDLMGMFNSFINWFFAISSVLATITCVLAAVKILSNPSNPKKRGEALGMFTKALIGMAIVLLAWLVMKTVIGALTNPNTNALRFFSN
jgi:hypothetical protein